MLANPSKVILAQVIDIEKARSLMEISTMLTFNSIVNIYWELPLSSWVKLNVDGATKKDHKVVGCGDLLRDNEGG